MTAARSADDMFGVVVAKDVMVPMRDGVRLATDVYRPAHDGEMVARIAFWSVPKRPTMLSMTWSGSLGTFERRR